MSHWRAKTLDLGCFIGTRVVRDHTKRMVFERFEPERYAQLDRTQLKAAISYSPFRRQTFDSRLIIYTGKPSVTLSETRHSLPESAPKPSCSWPR